MTISNASRQLMTDLQSYGLRLLDPTAGVASRRGGAGPSDHKAVTVDGHTIMVPVHTSGAWESPFVADAPDANGQVSLKRGTIPIAQISFPKTPRFYALQTLDGVPYSHIATLHGADVLATTVLQNCIRYESRKKTCQFCSIGQSLAAKRTIAHKTPQQLAEVARAAVLLDGVKHMVLTTGTVGGFCINLQGRSPTPRIKAAIDIPEGTVRTTGRRPVVPPHEGRWRGHAGHAPGGRHTRGARTHHAGQGQCAAVALHECV